MKRLITFAAAMFFTVGAQAAAPSTESLEKLLEVTHIEKLLDSVRPQIQSMTKVMMDQALKGAAVSPQEQKILDDFRAKAAAISNEELSMAKMKPMYIRIYSASLTQEDVDGLIAFYESPTGQVMVTKMPKIMQAIMAEMPKLMEPMSQKMQQAGKEMQEQLAALKKKPAQ
ncbi:DUF2059 domain-containing protein [Undibacterium sp.]|jgi:hypothetical protein|uniref:DUF2059 domain-containing protein n=1 Tax=Undibacterium sp. TaxID=1914977 RepID=UPI002BC20539|nr:DUF2059 domain-containing protein [Undibacterium sp.]HTD06347.1 DUF2059 domain-containing protein [Undibacterium sp.]